MSSCAPAPRRRSSVERRSIAPAWQIGSRRRSLLNSLEDFGYMHRIVVETRQSIGKSGIAVPTMLGAVAIQDFAFIGRVGGSLQEIFDVVDGAVEKVGIRAAHIEVDLPPELG